MGRLHEWKGRMNPEHEGYPFGQPLPFEDHKSEPAAPAEAGLGAADSNGVTVAIAAQPAATVDVTFTGTANADHERVQVVKFTPTGASPRSVNVTFSVSNTDDATAIAAALDAACTAQVPEYAGSSTLGVVTLDFGGTVDFTEAYTRTRLT